MDASSSQPEFDYLFKLLLIGDSGVGKSSLLLSFTSDTFEDLSPTIGVDFKVKHVTMGGKKLKLAIWDTAGQERFRTLTSSYYRGAQGIIMVYDVTRRETFTNLSDVWGKEIDLYSTNQDCIKMLVGNKVDKESERVVTKKEGIDFAREYGCLFIECSAKTRVNVEQCFEELVLKILETPSLLAEGSTGGKRNIFKQKPPEPDASTSAYPAGNRSEIDKGSNVGGSTGGVTIGRNSAAGVLLHRYSLQTDIYIIYTTTYTKSGNAVVSMNVVDPPPSASSSSTSSSPPDVPPFNVEVDPQPTPPPAAEPPPQHQQQPGVLIPDPDALFSGGGISFLSGHRNASFSYGYSSFKGKRSSMEDFYETSISEVDGQMVAFFGVFDGHGGSRTAEYLKNNLFKNLSSHPDFIKDTKSAIVEAFRQTDADYLNEAKGQQKDAGSTASTAVLLGDRLLVANVGDSRVVACRAGSAVPLSIDHKPDRSDERQRIEQAGGFIIWAGTWRVGGVLAVSRAFGDKLLKPYVVAEPEIQEEEIDGVDFIIIASDGLWNVLSNKDAVTIVQDIKDAEAASRKLIQEAYARGSSDNITCVVVRFENTRE
ncbi:probable protein phosphatase 2C 11 [Rhododendron vialii]|uniref:probable protein phosphatase 2C 11 n=1 Tax=Rhododendron vialii TaxID=182163 RepID=UPI00265E1CDB|nr:probable protein phosphatase 2C 11 [Rhododendron vialii]